MILFAEVAVAAAAASPEHASAGPAARLWLRAADQDLVRRILSETRVARKPAGPSLPSYLGALMEAAARSVTRFFDQRKSLGTTILVAAEIFAALVITAAVVLFVLAIVRRVARARRVAAASQGGGWLQVPVAAAVSLDRLAWKREIEGRLSRGDVAGALEALWWWLAASLSAGAEIDASWTTRELFARARRPELFRLGSRLDVLMYGRASPSPEDVASCLARFEEALP